MKEAIKVLKEKRKALTKAAVEDQEAKRFGECGQKLKLIQSYSDSISLLLDYQRDKRLGKI